MKTIGRNDSCHCGSGKKYKNCCLDQDEQMKRGNKEDNRVIPFPGTVKESQQNSLNLRELQIHINQNLEWISDAHRELADKLFPEIVREYNLKDPESARLLYSMIMVWNGYSNDVNPKFRKPGGYAGALEYLMTHILGIPSTQSEIAAKHLVSVTTLGNTLSKVYDYIDETAADPDTPFPFIYSESDDYRHGEKAIYGRREMEEQMFLLTELINQQNFQSQEEMENFINAHMQDGQNLKALPKSDGAQARELLLKAELEQNPKKRIQFAREANKLDPGNADAYVVFAQEADTLDEALAIARNGLKNVEHNFGSSYFTENMGHFWGLIETRPYMRLKHFYMYLLRESGDDASAIREAEEMLVLCPNDNVGVRYELLMLYLLHHNFKAAERLFETYPENSASLTYDRMVMEYLQHGITPKLSSYKKAALQANAFVPAYLYGKKKLPRHLPEYISFGDENEAIEYVGSHVELWFRPEMVGLVKWMRNSK